MTLIVNVINHGHQILKFFRNTGCPEKSTPFKLNFFADTL